MRTFPHVNEPSVVDKAGDRAGDGVNDAYIFDAIRTPRGKGKKDGALSQISPIELLTPLYHAMKERNSLNWKEVEDIVLGCVSAVGDQGTNIAKISALYAGLPENVPGMTINRFCTSGLDACNLAAARIQAGAEDLLVAGGVESMSRVPLGADGGPWLTDPKTARATQAIHMGISADLIASLEGFSREDLDKFAFESQQKAARARSEGYFKKSIVTIKTSEGTLALAEDELIRNDTSLEQLSKLKPSFEEIGARGADALAIQKYPQISKINHFHHAGTSPGIADGAALVLIGNRNKGKELGLQPRAKIVAFATACCEPVVMLAGTTLATQKALRKAQLRIEDMDLFEINESFSAPVLKFQKDLGIPSSKINVNGGAIALGHALGATGAILVGTLLDELERRGLKYGLITLCAGAGLATATIIERV